MAIRGVHHINLAVEDMDLMCRFYRDGLGFEDVTAMDWGPGDPAGLTTGIRESSASMAMLKCGNVMIELIQYKQPEVEIGAPCQPYSRGYTHICLEITDIDAEYERLLGHGMTFHSPPPPLADRNYRAIYGRDPEGNLIELQELFGAENQFRLDTFDRLEAC